jgi:hypothetical protein
MRAMDLLPRFSGVLPKTLNLREASGDQKRGPENDDRAARGVDHVLNDGEEVL